MALLEITGLTIRFGGIVALEDVSFSTGQGQIMGVIGPNGAGKTTVFNCITRVYNPDEGSIVFENKNLRERAAHQVIGAGVARTFQNLELFNSMSVLHNLRFFGQMYGLRGKRLAEQTARVLDFIQLADRARQFSQSAAL